MIRDADIERAELERSARQVQSCPHESTYLPDLPDLPPFLRGVHKCEDCGAWIDPTTGRYL